MNVPYASFKFLVGVEPCDVSMATFLFWMINIHFDVVPDP